MKPWCVLAGFVVLFFITPLLFAVDPDRRFALVLGNSDYQHVESLVNPANDAADVAAKLRQLGFQVKLKLNVGNVEMGRVINDYVRQLASHPDNEGFFWYAGHGVQIEGENYLLPVDIDAEDDVAIQYGSYPLNRLIESFERTARNKLNLVILDACRNNPFRNTSGGNRSLSRGLSTVEHVPQDLFILFSTSAGAVAADGERGKRNSPFAEAFLKYMDSSEILPLVMADVSQETLRLTGGKQRPFPQGSIISEKYYSLNPQVAEVPQGGKIERMEKPAGLPARTSSNDLVRVQGGSFMMGSPTSEADRYSSEVRHQVRVSGFYMTKYEVSQGEYAALMGRNPSGFKGDQLPVENVTWYDAIEYCNKRSEREGLTPAYTIDKTRVDLNNTSNLDTSKWLVTWNRSATGYRLPTAAEWEYACRAGTSSSFSAGSAITSDQANFNGNFPYTANSRGSFRQTTTAVGSFAPNPWGLYDMHGNVHEWCWDWVGTYTTANQLDPAGASMGTGRIYRGGGWNSHAQDLRSASQDHLAPSRRATHIGFRVVRSGA
jgi:formylglycine-generating enzyme required for sulfatase activity